MRKEHSSSQLRRHFPYIDTRLSRLSIGGSRLNLSTLDALPAPHRSASSPDEPGIVFVHADKARRGRRSVMTVPVTALRPELRPLGGDHQRAAVLNTSLTTAYGVFMLLLELTEPARALTGSRQALSITAPSPTRWKANASATASAAPPVVSTHGDGGWRRG